MIADAVLNGDKRSISRLITLVENGKKEGFKEYEIIYKHTGRAFRVGFTGPPGAGKSTLLGLLGKEYIDAGFKVAILAVDPTSPYTGGAFLGDRLRMGEIKANSMSYIRSMGSRGGEGGLSKTVDYAADILDAAGYDYIFIETAGTGQTDVRIKDLTDIVVLITVPDLGDDIQANKAGIMEVADIIDINKADREGAERTLNHLKSVFSITNSAEFKIVMTDCIGKKGIDKLKKEINLILDYRIKNNEISKGRMESYYKKLKNNVADAILDIYSVARLENLIEYIYLEKLSPHMGARMLIKNLFSQEGDYDK